MEEFLKAIPSKTRDAVDIILQEDVDVDMRIDYLAGFLEPSVLKLYPSFLELLRTKEKRNVAEFLIKNRDFYILRSFIMRESEEAQEHFEKWFKLQPEYKIESQKPIQPQRTRDPILADFLTLLSSDQRRILINMLITRKQWNKLGDVLKTESQEAQDYFQKWKAHEEQKQEMNRLNRKGEITSDTEDESSDSAHDSLESDFNSDYDDDSDEDPNTWVPKIRENFFDKFPDCVNILILGETGVGKSTFINGLANYLKYSNMYQAKDHVEILIPAYFNYSDQDYNQRRIECIPTTMTEAAVNNENTLEGASSTLSAKSYKVSWGPSGSKKYIRIIDTPGVGDVGGIGKDAENFNSILNFIAQFDTTFSSTMFCFDNESFRCLCAWREGVNFTQNELASFNISWKNTVRETFRLFKHISQLPPHKVRNTVSVNDVRAVILSMARPLAEISKNKATNIQLIEEKEKEIQDCLKQGKDLDGKLFVEQVDLVPQELPYPMTVCAADKCIERRKLSSHPNAPTEIHYKQICHDQCALEGIQIVDPAMEESWKKCDDKRKTAESFLDDLKAKKSQLEKEADLVKNHCAEFTAFLKANSITPYNDMYKEYIDHLINESKGTVEQGGSSDVLKKLEETRDEYDAQVKLIDSQTSAKSTRTIKDIYGMIDKLKQLEHVGPVLQEVQKLELISAKKQQDEEPVLLDTKGGCLRH